MNLRKRNSLTIFQTGLFYVKTLVPSFLGSGPLLSRVLSLKHNDILGSQWRESLLGQQAHGPYTVCVADDPSSPAGFCSVCSPCSSS